MLIPLTPTLTENSTELLLLLRLQSGGDMGRKKKCAEEMEEEETRASDMSEYVYAEKTFSYIRGSDKGPKRWGSLHREWAACKNGRMQSPVDILNSQVVGAVYDLKMSYTPTTAVLSNKGHVIEVGWLGDAGSIQINGTTYRLEQCHWHSPSEHYIDGKSYDLELHMVHKRHDSMKPEIAVVALLFQVGRPNDLLGKLHKNIESISGREGEQVVGTMDPREIIRSSEEYYRYMGSLTTPPCSETVIWTIDSRVRTVSKEQVNILQEAVYDYARQNARPLQPLNDRKIYHHTPR
ncbi:alpha carbonic anhydrase 7-like [Malania oleifera]|uniref:alpha carbonic anhydrase 7-like n=1 Tax=Malania oleifera TaxID=397392 RepID=UPI0025ADC520|nr:alpha carbonic anhydrase 7-like [Malania oleifera]